MTLPKEISVQEFKKMRDEGADPKPVLLDVRTPQEHATAAIAGSVLIPLQELRDRTAELEAFRGKPVVVHCHHGMRSLTGAAFLRELNFDATSMRGGIDAWSVEIDPKVKRY